jgi:predicted nucleic acid-binding protein
MGVTYDTGVLIAADRNDRAVWALHAGLLAEEATPTVPSPVIAAAWRRGGRHANLSRFLASCNIEDLTFDQAKAVGVLAGRAAHGDIVDVAVAEGAIRRADAVITSDPAHIRAIADAVQARLQIESV